MAVYDKSRTQYQAGVMASPILSFSHLAEATVGAVAHWREARATRKALSRLSDHELDDIGLCRADIGHVARHS